MKWLEENGLTYKSIKFPAAFGNNGIPGVISTEEIPPFTEICDIPCKLLLSLDFIRKGELKSIFEKNKSLFYQEKEADSICFSVHFLRMMIKGDSFWKAYINRMLSQDTELCCQWSDDLLEELQDPIFVLNIKGYGKELEKQWKNVSAVLTKNPEKFPKDKWNRTMYMKIYKYVSTHTFGGHMPCSMAIPFAECFNHENCCPIYLEIFQLSKGKPPITEEIFDPDADYSEMLNEKQIWHLPKDPEMDIEEEGSEDESDEDYEEEKSKLITKINPSYKWWNPTNSDIHCFMRTGPKPIPANSQIYYWYGVRANSDLMNNFGFLLVPNSQDMLKMVLWNNLNPWTNLKTNINSIFVPESMAAKIATEYKETLFDVEDPNYVDAEIGSRIVKLCWYKVPSESLMSYIRKQQMPQYKGANSEQLMMSNPIIPEFEIECLEIAIQILLLKKKTWKTSIEEDIKVLEETKTRKKWRWLNCVYYRIAYKKLLEFHIEAYKLLIEILKNIINPNDKYKDAYMKLTQYDKDENEIIVNRLIFRNYLQKLAQSRKFMLNVPFE